MKVRRVFALTVFAVALTAVFASAALAQSSDGNLANVYGGGSTVKFEVVAQNTGVTLTITAPDGRSFTKEYRAGAAPGFDFSDKGLPDGTYTYELRLRPSLTAAQRESMKGSRGKDDDPENERAARKPTGVQSLNQSGAFALVNGQVIVGGLSEGRTAKTTAPAATPAGDTATPLQTTAAASSAKGLVTSGNTFSRLRNHRVSLLANYMFDFVIADDLIVQGSACVGLDCVDGENFGFDTIRTKENNVRIQFDDTSTSAGFPSNNWQIRANSSSSGGGNFLAFVDQGTTGNSETGTIVFEVDAGAPANSLRVSSSGKTGIRTGTPVLDVHVNSTDTPAFRMEQNNTGGFTAQTWDIGANEANWFVRDVTSGSRLPLRIRPGAPTSSVDISATGNVGIGTASPTSRVYVQGGSAGAETILQTINSSGATTNTAASLQFVINGDTEVGRIKGISTNALTSSRLSFSSQGGADTLNLVSGNVGIGTTAPDQKLSVNGDASKTGGATWQAFSDVRLKNIKGNYTSGLSAVMRLQPLRYEYKSDNPLGLKSNREMVGFSAQDLQKVIPEAVTQTQSGYLMVNSDPILWTMLNAIKEQQKEIEELKSQIQKLKKPAARRRR